MPDLDQTDAMIEYLFIHSDGMTEEQQHQVGVDILTGSRDSELWPEVL